MEELGDNLHDIADYFLKNCYNVSINTSEKGEPKSSNQKLKLSYLTKIMLAKTNLQKF